LLRPPQPLQIPLPKLPSTRLSSLDSS
jgi:hypothetical protein